MILFDSRDPKGGGGFVWKNGLSPEAKPRVTGHFSRPPPPPESRELNSIPVTPGISHFVLLYLQNSKTKLSKGTQKLQTSVLQCF